MDHPDFVEIRKEMRRQKLSGFLNRAMGRHLHRRRILRLLDELDAKYGAPSPELMAEIEADAKRIFGK